MDKLAAALAGFGSHLPTEGEEEHDGGGRRTTALAPAFAAPAPGARRGVGYVRVDGSHDSTERLAAVKRFKSDPSCRVALLSITAAAVGLDFSSASMVVFVELPNEVSLVRQAEDRAHRKGQAAKAVNVYFLCAQGTVDDKRWQALNLSLAHISQVHDGEVLPQPLARAEAAAQPTQQPQSPDAAGADALADAAAGGSSASLAADADAHTPAAAGSGGPAQQPPQAEAEAAAAAATAGEPVPAGQVAAAAQGGSQAAAAAAAAAAPEGAGPEAAPAPASPGADVIDLTADSPVATAVNNTSSTPRRTPGRFRPLLLSPSDSAFASQRAAAAAAPAGGLTQPSPTQSPTQEQALHSAATPAAAGDAASPAADASGLCGGALTPLPPEVWFEVSRHTNRLHYHLAADGSRPLGLNIPLESLLLPQEGTLQQLAAAWARAWQQQLQERAAEGQQEPVQQEQQPAEREQQQSLPPGGLQSSPFFASSQQAGVGRPGSQHKSALSALHAQLPFGSEHDTSAAAAAAERLGSGRLAGSQLQHAGPEGCTDSECQHETLRQQVALGSQGAAAPADSCGFVGSSPALMVRVRHMLAAGGSQPEQGHLEQQLERCEAEQQADGGARRLSLCLDSPRAGAAAGQCCSDVVMISASEDEEEAQQQPQQSQQQQQQSQRRQLLLLGPDAGPSQQQSQPQSQPQAQLQRGQQLLLSTDGGPSQQQQQQQQQEPGQQQEQAACCQAPSQQPAAAAPGLPDCRVAPGFMTPSGLACLTLPLSPVALLELLRQGAAFAADFSELRSITRNRLVGRVLPPDLASAVEAATAAAAGAGAFGVGTTRYLRDIEEGDPNLPPGARLVTVAVHYPNGRQQLVNYRQAFTGGTAPGVPLVRHCINCFKPVEGAVAAQDAVLQGGLDLFCTMECERAWVIKSSSSGIRRALFKLERGVCQLCNLDCHALVAQLQQIAKDSPHWLEHRRAVVASLAPKFMERGCLTLLDRLINQATEGNAWHADHILAVYEGGGGCDLDNLRTLCTACHAAVTKKQAAARAAERQRRKLGTQDIRLWFGGLGATGSAGSGGGGSKAGLKRKRNKGAAAAAAAGFVESDDEGGSGQAGSGTAAAAAAVPAAPTKQQQRTKPAPAAAAKKRGRPSKKQKAAAAAAAAGSRHIDDIFTPAASKAAAASTGGRHAAVTPHQLLQGEAIELLDSQPSSQPAPPDSATAALNTTPARLRVQPRFPAAAAAVAAAAAAGAGADGLQSVLQQFKFSQEPCDGSQQPAGDAAAAAGSGGGRTRRQQQQPSKQQHGKRPPAKQGPPAAARKRRRAGQQQHLQESDDNAGSDFADEGLTAAERRQLAAAAAQAATAGAASGGAGAAGREAAARGMQQQQQEAGSGGQGGDGSSRSGGRRAAAAAAVAAMQQEQLVSSDDDLIDGSGGVQQRPGACGRGASQAAAAAGSGGGSGAAQQPLQECHLNAPAAAGAAPKGQPG